MRPALLIALLLFPAPLAAQDLLSRLEGLYRPAYPEYADWNCRALGQDGGAVGIRDGMLVGTENACALTTPTPVRGMNAMLFDSTCNGEGVRYDGGRVMLMTSPAGLYLVRDGSAVEWQRC